MEKLHARVGDLWWYSAMLFVACRSGDVIQAFIGLWLVPKYVGPKELGTVLPLQQLSSFFTVPLAVVAVVFSKYVNTYATRGERGKVKSFIHDVIIVSAALMLVCIAAAYWLIPHFYSRLNIAAGSLTVLVLASGFVGNLSGLFGSALQGLKKFKTMTVTNLISAPIRLVTLLIAMPFRPLSGYLLGQTTPSASCGLLAALSIHKDLRDAPADTSWRKDLPEIWRYLWPIAIYTSFATFFGTISATIFRQRLPEIESSAYYILSRFADIAGFISGSMMIVLIPLASEAHEKGQESTPLIRHTIIGISATTCITAIFFFIAGDAILNSTQNWNQYAEYASLLPLLTIITGLSGIIATIISYDMACRRFSATIVVIILGTACNACLIFLAGIDAFSDILSPELISRIKSYNFNHLEKFLIYNLIWLAVQLLTILIIRARCISLPYARFRNSKIPHP